MKLGTLYAIVAFSPIIGCAVSRPAVDAVIAPASIGSERCKPLQERHYPELLSLAKRIPFSMEVNTMGFLEFKGKIYFSIQLVGDLYNTIKTSASTRLSTEFAQKYSETMKVVLPELMLRDAEGIHTVLICYSSNFATDRYAVNRATETLEIFAGPETVRAFIVGDITGQDFLDRSMVFVNGQRTRFTLEMM